MLLSKYKKMKKVMENLYLGSYLIGLQKREADKSEGEHGCPWGDA